MKESMKAFWGAFFIVALIGPYLLGVWDDYGYAAVVAAAITFLLIVLLRRQVTLTFWWEGLWRKKENSAPTKRKS